MGFWTTNWAIEINLLSCFIQIAYFPPLSDPFYLGKMPLNKKVTKSYKYFICSVQNPNSLTPISMAMGEAYIVGGMLAMFPLAFLYRWVGLSSGTSDFTDFIVFSRSLEVTMFQVISYVEMILSGGLSTAWPLLTKTSSLPSPGYWQCCSALGAVLCICWLV